jgi:hypothetical protein
MASDFGYPLFDPLAKEEESDSDKDENRLENFFPDMSAVKNVQWGNKSGLIVISARR